MLGTRKARYEAECKRNERGKKEEKGMKHDPNRMPAQEGSR